MHCNMQCGHVDNGWKNAGERSAFSQNMFRAPSSLFLRRIHVGISIKYSAKNESLLGDEHHNKQQTLEPYVNYLLFPKVV